MSVTKLHSNHALKNGIFTLSVMALALGALPAHSEPISINPDSINMFRDNRGVNDIGITPGDRLQYGANVLGGSLGTSLSGFYAPQNLTDAASPCAPLLSNQNFCSNSIAFSNTNPASQFFGVPRNAEPWTFTFTRPGETPLVVAGLDLTGTSFLVPHPTNVTISGSGATPTISWTLPAGYVPDGFRIQIYDKDLVRANGVADIIHSVAVGASATSYDIPAVLTSGLTLKDDGSGRYSINFEVVETRGDVVFTNQNRQILTRSQSFFSFTPLTNTAPPNVFLPEVGPDLNPNDNRGAPFVFTVGSVGPTSKTFIDPFVATGYDYAIGAGDPNFASVLLPNVGDGFFELLFLGSGGQETHILAHDVEFFFPGGGVAAFSIRGIETSAGLDPSNVSAFITGLTFVSTGSFTGTMTPITAFVEAPEPVTLALLGLGLAGLGLSRRKRT